MRNPIRGQSSTTSLNESALGSDATLFCKPHVAVSCGFCAFDCDQMSGAWCPSPTTDPFFQHSFPSFFPSCDTVKPAP